MVTSLLTLNGYFLGIILLTSGCHIIRAQLLVTSRHDSFLPLSQTPIALEGSVLWLYCDVNSTSSSLSVTWVFDRIRSLVQDVPHIRLRTSTSSSSTTLLLVVDNVVSSDGGVYQCTAQDGLNNASGNEFNLKFVSLSRDGRLRIVTQDPLTMISGPVSYSSQTNRIYPNRTAVNTGANVTLSFTSGHVGDDMTNYPTPSSVWLKDGIPFRITPTGMAVGDNGQLRSNLSFTFQASDAGVYQCIFNGSFLQRYWSIPLRLDTGSSSVPERVSPPVVFLTPPEKLVLEVRASGGYDFVNWSRVGDTSFGHSLSELVNFHEVFVREPTTTSEYGTYQAFYSSSEVGGSEAVAILVVPTASTNTTADTSVMVTVSEGGSVSISCISSGGPIPTITWTLNNLPTNFSQTDVITNPTDTTTPGHVMSTLHIVNAQYPTHAGVYTCTGTNTLSGSARTDSATITVLLQVAPPTQLSVVSVSSNTFTITWSYQSSQLSFFTVTIVDDRINKPIKTNIDSSNAEVTNISMWRATFEELSPATRYNVTITATYEDELGRSISTPSSIELFTSSSTTIQIRFEVTALCSDWINQSPVQKSEDIVNELKMLLLNFCSCVSLNDKIFSNGGFRCFKKSLNHVTYRARLHGTASVSAMELAAHYDVLLASGPVLNIEAQFVNADSFCPVVIDSFDEAECVMATTNMTFETYLIVVIIVCSVIVLILILIVLVAVIIAIRRKRTKKSVIYGDIMSPPALPSDRVNSNMANNQAPQYQYIDTKFHGRERDNNSKKENDKNHFIFTQCDAYGTTAFSANQNESDNNFSTVPLERTYATIN